MKKILLSFITISIVATALGQNGTSLSPYTSIGQARNVTSAGIYYFNISGNLFNTYVDVNGFVQIARDFGGITGNLPITSSFISTSTRGVLPTAALGQMFDINEVRTSTTTGNVDVSSLNATLISRLKSGTTLHQGVADNVLNDSWTGTGAILFTANAGCGTASGTTLAQNIIHPCGNANTFHWIPNASMHQESAASGENAGSVAFILWARAPLAIVLPIHLISFEAKRNGDGFVFLYWQTSSEINSSYFDVERSINGNNWVFVTKVNARQNSATVTNYSATDSTTFSGNTFYRLKQADLDGKITYSKVVTIKNEKASAVKIYPTVTSGEATINGVSAANFRIVSSMGQDVSNNVGRQNLGSDSWKLDFSLLPKGVYRVVGKGFAVPVVVQ